MYYTHGDTVIFRSDRPERTPPHTRKRAREREAEERVQEPRRSQPSVEQVLAMRVSELEERLARIEAELQAAREVEVARPAPPTPRQGGGGRQRQGQAPGEVKVSLHAEGGAQATVGQVRMRNDE